LNQSFTGLRPEDRCLSWGLDWGTLGVRSSKNNIYPLNS